MTFEEKKQIIEEILKIHKNKHLIDIRQDEIELLATLKASSQENIKRIIKECRDTEDAYLIVLANHIERFYIAQMVEEMDKQEFEKELDDKEKFEETSTRH
jgi:predicted nucleic acid-binding protein